MGLFGHWVVAKCSSDALREAGFGDQVIATKAKGWLIGYPDQDSQLPEWPEFDEAIAGVAASVSAPTLGAWVYDSDVGYVVVAEGNEVVARLLINHDRARGVYGIEEVTSDEDEQTFAQWSSAHAPQAAHANEIRGTLAQNWTLAEEGIQELLSKAGLAEPPPTAEELLAERADPALLDEIRATELGGYYAAPAQGAIEIVGGRQLRWRDARYVLGHGQGFVGIWDRVSPEEPIKRFSATSEGEWEAEKASYELLLPDLLESKGVQERWFALAMPLVSFHGFPEGLDYSALITMIPEETRPRVTALIVTEEMPDESWRPAPHMSDADGSYFLYEFHDPNEFMSFYCVDAAQSFEDVLAHANRTVTLESEWERVPDDVPFNLLETARWTYEQVPRDD